MSNLDSDGWPMPDEPDDIDFGNAGGVAMMGEAEVQEAASFDIAPGVDIELMICRGKAGIELGKGGKYPPEGPGLWQVVLPDGTEASFVSQMVRVSLCRPSDPKRTVRQRLILPPADPMEMNAYWTGLERGDTRENMRGWSARVYSNFIRALGFPWEKGQPHPEAAAKSKNWLWLPNGRPRTFLGTIVPNGGKKDDGTTFDGTQLKLFKCKVAPATALFVGQGLAGLAPPAGRPAAGRPATAAVVPPTDDGSDDI